jgi:hypothetical protein
VVWELVFPVCSWLDFAGKSARATQATNTCADSLGEYRNESAHSINLFPD